MPALTDVHPHDGHAVTHHRRHAINQPVQFDDNDPPEHHEHVCNDNCGTDVTVSDLLDAYESGDVSRDDFHALRDRASDNVLWSFDQIDTLLNAYAGLSPEERAEFDRRTT